MSPNVSGDVYQVKLKEDFLPPMTTGHGSKVLRLKEDFLQWSSSNVAMESWKVKRKLLMYSQLFPHQKKIGPCAIQDNLELSV